jgi:hypothetical protein
MKSIRHLLAIASTITFAACCTCPTPEPTPEPTPDPETIDAGTTTDAGDGGQQPVSFCCDDKNPGDRCGKDSNLDGIPDGICRGYLPGQKNCYYGCDDSIYSCHATESIGRECSPPCDFACNL